MRRNRVVFWQDRVIEGEEIYHEDFPDLETLQRYVALWEGAENVMVMRNVEIDGMATSDRIDYLLLDRRDIAALGLGKVMIQGFSPH